MPGRTPRQGRRGGEEQGKSEHESPHRCPPPRDDAGILLSTDSHATKLFSGQSAQDSQASCVIVEVPKDDPAFVASALLREHAKTVREFIRSKLLKGQEPSPRGSVMQHPPFVEVTGQLFYDDAHVGDQPRGKKGCKAATLWELHPVTAITFTTP
jgi:hypothetical protein